MHRARCTITDEPVIVKLFHTPVDGDAERWVRELESIRRVQHEGVVQILDHGRIDGQPFLVMPLVDGQSFRAWCQGRAPIDILRCVVSVARAVEACHRKGVLHLDLTPTNILVDHTTQLPLLIDFGLAHELEDNVTFTGDGRWMGTPRYMAPEQVRGRGMDARTDVYALGIVLYEALARRAPFPQRNSAAVMMAQIEAPVPDLALGAPDLPAVQLLQVFLAGCLAKSPNDRWSSMAIFAQHLSSILEVIDQPERHQTLMTKLHRAKGPATVPWSESLTGFTGIALALATFWVTGQGVYAWANANTASPTAPSAAAIVQWNSNLDIQVDRSIRAKEATERTNARAPLVRSRTPIVSTPLPPRQIEPNFRPTTDLKNPFSSEEN